MRYWLLKSEPSSWSWQHQQARGDAGEGWDGVRNHQASNNMKAMEIGDLAFFYHSVNEKQIVGIVEIIELYHPDPTDRSGRFGMVTVKAVKSMAQPVTLADIRADERVAGHGTGAPGTALSDASFTVAVADHPREGRDQPLITFTGRDAA
jgi:predicted RNA-binding protein with PUA-like domain